MTRDRPFERSNNGRVPTNNNLLDRLGIDRSTQKDIAQLGLVIGAAAVGKEILDSISEPEQPHRVFISHSWRHPDQFNELIEILNDAGIEWHDYSVSKDQPLDAQLPNHLRKKLRDQIRPTSVVIVLAGMYAARSDWIKEEVDIANDMGKQIIGVRPSGNERTPRIVRDNAVEVVEMDSWAIQDAIDNYS